MMGHFSKFSAHKNSKVLNDKMFYYDDKVFLC